MFYFFLFFISTLFLLHAEKAYANNHRLFVVLSLISLVWLSFWAGGRDLSIGTDTTFYGVDVFNVASASEKPIEDAFLNPYMEIEPFFFLLNYLASKVGGIGFALFLIMFIQLLFAFYGLKNFMSSVPLWMMMLAYILIFYILSLNLMRQGIAVSIGLYALRYIEKRKFLPLLLIGIFAFYWHKTSVVFFAFLLLLYFYRYASVFMQRILLLIVIPLSLLSIFSFMDILLFIADYVEEMGHFILYADTTNSKHDAFLNTVDIVSRVLLIALVFALHQKRTTYSQYYYVLYLILFVDLASRFLGQYTAYATRIAYYFVAVEIPYLFMIINSSQINVQQRRIITIALLLLFSFMTVRENFYYGLNETYPYVFRWLGMTLY
jgi:hypothetical protein